MKLIGALSIFLVSTSYLSAQSPEFNALLKNFQKTGQEIPLDVASKYFGFEPNDPIVYLKTNGIIGETDRFILLSTYTDCGAGGICERSTLHSFDLQGNKIDKTRFEYQLGDCSVHDRRSVTFISDTLIIFTFTGEENDCDLDERIALEVEIEFQGIREDGTFEELIVEEINTEREYFYSSSILLIKEDLTEFTGEDLAVMRNEIFASYGFIFKKKKWHKYFEGKEWYDGTSENVDDWLTVIELLNLDLITKLESQKTTSNEH